MRKNNAIKQTNQIFLVGGRTYPCPFQLTMSVIESKWKLRIIHELVSGTLRYGELRKAVSGITHKMLIQSLRELEEDQVVKRTMYPEVPPRVEYELSRDGKRLTKVIDAMTEFGLAYAKK